MQLTIFESLATGTANNLLEMLNEGLKPKERWHPVSYIPHKEYYIYVAQNKEGKNIFNVVDNQGNTPNGFSANWRSAQHVVEELKLSS